MTKLPHGRSELPIYMPKVYMCPLSGELMQEPVILVESAQTYEQKAIVDWLEQGMAAIAVHLAC